jgi:hypothetical protein
VTRGQGVGLGKILEQFRLLLRGHADAAIRDRKLDLAAAAKLCWSPSFYVSDR